MGCLTLTVTVEAAQAVSVGLCAESVIKCILAKRQTYAGHPLRQASLLYQSSLKVGSCCFCERVKMHENNTIKTEQASKCGISCENSRRGRLSVIYEGTFFYHNL